MGQREGGREGVKGEQGGRSGVVGREEELR